MQIKAKSLSRHLMHRRFTHQQFFRNSNQRQKGNQDVHREETKQKKKTEINPDRFYAWLALTSCTEEEEDDEEEEEEEEE